MTLISDIDCVIDHLVVHLPAEVLELLTRVLQRLLLHVVRGRVGQQLVQRDDVARDLSQHKYGNILNFYLRKST